MTKQTTDNEEITLTKLAQEYADDDNARALLESLRWPQGAFCPHCKATKPYILKPRKESQSPARKGLYKCRSCQKQFTVTVNTIFADSKLPINKWVMAFFILVSAKKGVSAHQMHRMIGVTYKTSWFLCHRIRHAFKLDFPAEKLRGQVEVDETFVGGVQPINTGTGKRPRKPQVVALVERGGGLRVKVVERLSSKTIGQFLRDNVAMGSTLNTDGNPNYDAVYLPKIKHESVNHSRGELQRERADGTKVHVNSCESFFSLLKRGITGSFHHVSKEHLHRYADEFAFRWNNRKITDGERFIKGISMVEGKRLKYTEMVRA